MRGIAETFKRVPFLSALSQDHLKALEEISVLREYPAKSVIFTPLQKADGFYLLKEGKVKIYKLEKGKEQIIKIFSQPAFFGEAASFTGENFPAWAETVEDSQVIFFSRKDFLHLMERKPQIALNMMSIMAHRLIYLTKVIESLSLKNALSKVSSYILRNQVNGELVFKTNLAALELGLTKETVSRMLSKLKKMGLIEKEREVLKIKDIEGLKRLA